MDIFGKKKEEMRVPLNSNTLNNCICSKCPVQMASTCSSSKMQKLVESMKMPSPSTSSGSGMMGSTAVSEDKMEEAKLPEPKEIPGVYCSIDKTACNDLNISKSCICAGCQNYKTTTYQIANQWSITVSTGD